MVCNIYTDKVMGLTCQNGQQLLEADYQYLVQISFPPFISFLNQLNRQKGCRIHFKTKPSR